MLNLFRYHWGGGLYSIDYLLDENETIGFPTSFKYSLHEFFKKYEINNKQEILPSCIKLCVICGLIKKVEGSYEERVYYSLRESRNFNSSVLKYYLKLLNKK